MITLAIRVVSAGMLSFGLLWRDVSFVVAAAILHILEGVVGLYPEYRRAKRFRAGTWKPEEKSFAKRIADWIGGAITLTGLILAIAGQETPTNGYSIAGCIIWGGSILCYLLCGFIGGIVGGIPLRMGYGGWEVDRGRKRR